MKNVNPDIGTGNVLYLFSQKRGGVGGARQEHIHTHIFFPSPYHNTHWTVIGQGKGTKVVSFCPKVGMGWFDRV